MKKNNYTGLTHDCGMEFNALAAFNKPMTTEIDGRVATEIGCVAAGVVVKYHLMGRVATGISRMVRIMSHEMTVIWS